MIQTEDDGMVLREYLREKLLFSTRLIKKVKSKEGGLIINDKPVTVRYVLKKDDILKVSFPPEERSNTMVAEELPLDVVYEDKDVLIIEKSAGIPSIPSQLHPSGTVANGILAYYDKRKLPYTVHIVTRLDKDTSGLLLIAKHQYSHSLLSDMQRENAITREYTAIVHGKLKDWRGTIDLPIGRKADSIIERTVIETGQRAVTHYEVIRIFEDYSLVNIRLQTGRTHQIRVHFSAIGHPLVGDHLYGAKQDPFLRQALHCSVLRFNQPLTKKPIEIISKLPLDMRRFLS